LRKLFPEYGTYADAVPVLLPGRPANLQKTSNPFRWTLYLRNQEYQAGAGFIAGMLFLLWKVLR
jgi:hypothetical protein